MDIIFQIEKENDKITKAVPLLPYNETANNISLKELIKTLQEVADKLNSDKNKIITFISLYVGNYKLHNNNNSSFSILIRMRNGLPYKILSVNDSKYNYYFNDTERLLNQENEKENVEYKIFTIRGEID